MQRAFQAAQETVDRIDAELSEATPDAAGIEVLEESLVSLRGELERSEDVYADIVEQIEVLNRECRGLMTELGEAQKAVAELEFKLRKAQGTVRQLQGQREDELKNKNTAIAKVTAAEENRVEWQKHLEAAQATVAEAIEGARRVCERVPVPRGKSSADLEALWKKYTDQREAAQKELGGSQDELLRQANEAKRIHKEAMQELEDIKNLRNVGVPLPAVYDNVTDLCEASDQHVESSPQSLETV